MKELRQLAVALGFKDSVDPTIEEMIEAVHSIHREYKRDLERCVARNRGNVAESAVRWEMQLAEAMAQRDRLQVQCQNLSKRLSALKYGLRRLVGDDDATPAD